MQEKKFIYAVIENNAETPSSTASFSAALIGGIDAAPLETVCYRNLTAVVSAIDASRFNPNLSGQASSAQNEEREERLKADLLKYQQVNSWLLEQTRRSGMLPLRFGLTASNRQEVEGVLERVYIQLRIYLDRLKGKVELVVQASWDLQNILPGIAHDHPELLSADPLQTGKMLFEAAEAKRKKFVQALHDKLSPFATDFSEGPRKAEETIFNRSYLVAREQEPLFDEAMNALGNQYEGILSFRYIGPLPAYSFVNIELNQGNFALLDKARKTLQLPEKASWEQIKTAYRKLILIHHPDRNPDSPEAAQRCKEVLAAYEMVSAYCQSLQGVQGVGERSQQGEFSFVQEAVEKVFIADNKGALLA